MQLIDFIDACDIGSKDEVEIFELLCYYLTKEEGTASFSVKKMERLYGEIGLAAPDRTALKKKVVKNGSFRPYGIEGTLRFGKDALRSLEKRYGHLWLNTVTSDAPMPAGVRLTDFAETCEMSSRSDMDNFELLCYYLAKEKGMKAFSARNMSDLYEDAGLAAPDRAALEKGSRKHPSFSPIGFEGTLAFRPEAFESLDSRLNRLWIASSGSSADNVPAGSEVIDEKRFCGKRDGLDRLIAQINSSYRNGHYDAFALLMRRLLESALILSFQAAGKENEIRDGHGKYVPVGGLAQKCDVLGLAGIKEMLDAVSGIGDYSCQGPTYVSGVNDINSFRISYREALDAIFATF